MASKELKPCVVYSRENVVNVFIYVGGVNYVPKYIYSFIVCRLKYHVSLQIINFLTFLAYMF